MQTYTVICCDTGEYECSSNPPHRSVRIFLIDEGLVSRAADRARDFLLDEFGDKADEWRVVAVLIGNHQPFTASGATLKRIDKK